MELSAWYKLLEINKTFAVQSPTCTLFTVLFFIEKAKTLEQQSPLVN